MLNCTCLGQALRNPTPKMTTMRPVGRRARQLQVGAPRSKSV